jgi:uncharacterized protein YdaT
MPWTKTGYPLKMNWLHQDLSARAVDVANQQVEESRNESEAILRGVDRASAWTHLRNNRAQTEEGRRSYKNNTENPGRPK